MNPATAISSKLNSTQQAALAYLKAGLSVLPTRKDKRQIEVKRSCRRGRITDTKNHKRRRVDMTPHLSETLQDLKLKQELDAMVAGRSMPEWVFANKKGKIFSRVALENALNRCLDENQDVLLRVSPPNFCYYVYRFDFESLL